MKPLATASIGLAYAAALFLPALAQPVPPMAVQGSQTTTLTVHAHVVRTCLVSATSVDFGDYDPLVMNRTQPLDAQGSIGLHCTKNTGVKLAIDAGSNAQGSDRYLSSGTDTLNYELYFDPYRTAVYGGSPFTLGADVMRSLGAASTTGYNRPVYGRIPGGQNVTPGDYTDTVTVTINF